MRAEIRAKEEALKRAAVRKAKLIRFADGLVVSNKGNESKVSS